MFKKTSLFTMAVLGLTLIISLASINPGQAATNLVGNPGFETGSVSPWYFWGSGGSVVSSNTHSGTYAAQLTGSSLGVQQDNIPVSPNTSYTLTGWAKVSKNNNTVNIGAKNFGGAEQYLAVTSTSYQQKTITFTTGPTNTTATIYCWKSAGAQSAYCDDFSLTEAGPAPTATPLPTRSLIWSDEFNTAAGTLPNTADWGYEIGYKRNNELQYYTNTGNNAYMDGNGNLVIKAMQDTTYSGYNYTSASINTSGKHSWQYGRIEMRAKLPYGKGIWPAFWGMGDRGRWPASGEIDVMELIGGGPGYDNVAHGTAHWDDGGHQQAGGQYTLPSGNYCDAYHIFAIEWNAQTITWFVDSTAYATVNISGAAQSELRQPFYIMLNLAVGGSWPGNPDGTTVFPQYYTIDYVRIYQ